MKPRIAGLRGWAPVCAISGFASLAGCVAPPAEPDFPDRGPISSQSVAAEAPTAIAPPTAPLPPVAARPERSPMAGRPPAKSALWLALAPRATERARNAPVASAALPRAAFWEDLRAAGMALVPEPPRPSLAFWQGLRSASLALAPAPANRALGGRPPQVPERFATSDTETVIRQDITRVAAVEISAYLLEQSAEPGAVVSQIGDLVRVDLPGPRQRCLFSTTAIDLHPFFVCIDEELRDGRLISTVRAGIDARDEDDLAAFERYLATLTGREAGGS